MSTCIHEFMKGSVILESDFAYFLPLVCIKYISKHYISIYPPTPLCCSARRSSPSELAHIGPRSPRSPMHETNRYSRHAMSDLSHVHEDEDEVFTHSPRHSAGNLRSPVDPYLSEDEAKVMRRATRVLMYVLENIYRFLFGCVKS